MYISDYSIMLAIIWSSLFILVTYAGLKKKRYIRWFGTASLTALYLICMMRLLLPFEMPYTIIIGVEGVFADIYEVIALNSYSVLGLDAKIINIVAAVWLSGSIITFIKWLISYNRAIKKIKRIKKDADTRCTNMLSEVKKIYRREINVNVWISPQISIPMGAGVLQKKILLPEIAYEDQTLYNILLHEYTHFVNHDIAVKLLVHIGGCIFWWNPCVYLLKKELDQALELRCDHTVIKSMDKWKRLGYLNTILETIKNIGSNSSKNVRNPMAPMARPNAEKEIRERFEVIADDLPEPDFRKKVRSVLAFVAMCVIMAGTYLVQVQASFFNPPTSELSPEDEITADEAYIIDNGDGTYTLKYFAKDVEGCTTDKKDIIYDLVKQGWRIVKNEE
jgi:beta-lactamase regulating signal transducer with metallopeptidase domain